jgi:excisionase family DNA binding protein
MIDGLEYLSSKSAALLTGYSQDYVGQLARGGDIKARRVGGLWYISRESLEAYVANETSEAEANPEDESNTKEQGAETTTVDIEDEEYISASRAAKITKYNQDYIGQLVRSGKIDGKQVGRRWYINQKSILAHKQEKEEQLVRAQVKSVGLGPMGETEPNTQSRTDVSPEPQIHTYHEEAADLIPLVNNAESRQSEYDEIYSVEAESEKADFVAVRHGDPETIETPSEVEIETHIPIRVATVNKRPRLDTGLISPLLTNNATVATHAVSPRIKPLRVSWLFIVGVAVVFLVALLVIVALLCVTTGNPIFESIIKIVSSLFQTSDFFVYRDLYFSR